MQKKITFLILMSLFTIYLVGCLTSDSFTQPSAEPDNRVPISGVNELGPSATQTGEITTPTSRLTEDTHVSPSKTTEKPTTLYSVPDIPTGYIHNLIWSSDSRTISFKIDHEEWVHDLFSQVSGPATINQPDSVRTVTPELTIEIPDSFLDSLNLASQSPSGQRAIFFDLDIVAGQTPFMATPATDGELPIEPSAVEIWIGTTDGATQIATIDICGPNRFLWSEDERFVTIQTSCLFPEIWSVDFEKESLFPVLPLEEYGGFVDLYGYTADQRNLLISYAGADEDGQFTWLYAVDLETTAATKLETPRFVWPIASLTSEKLVILYSHHFGIDGTKRPALLDLQDNRLTNLLDSEYNELLEGLDIQWIALSPDKNYLAFTTVHEPFTRSTLWLLKINT
jgi:hypothetical protein